MTSDAHRSAGDVSHGMVQPLMLLPIQFFTAPDVSRPERGLMMAVLADAVRCIENYRSSDTTRAEQEYAEAQAWLLADEPNWPYSFEHICAVLRLDPDAVRQRLRVLPSQAHEQSESLDPALRRRVPDKTSDFASGSAP